MAVVLQEEMIPAGTVLGNRYEVLAVLAGTGKSLVYTARDRETGQLCAIKVLDNCSESVYKRFQREASIISKLNHPGICRLLDCRLNQRTQPFLVMEHVHGQDMETFLTNVGPQPPEWAIPVFAQICDALTAAHEAGVVHRNVRPAAVMLTGDIKRPLAKILDFGFAKPFQKENQPSVLDLTEAGVAVGALLYLSPEQTKGKPADTRSDIFSLGCLMYRTFTGKNAFQAGNLPELIKRHAERPQKISRANPNMHVPETLEKIIFRCLDRNPASRFQSMQDLKRALEGGDTRVSNRKPLIIAGVSIAILAAAVAVAVSIMKVGAP